MITVYRTTVQCWWQRLPVNQIVHPRKPPRWPMTWPRLSRETLCIWYVTLVAFVYNTQHNAPVVCRRHRSVLGSSAAELWRHGHFQDGGRQPYWIRFRAMVAHPRSVSDGLCFIIEFRLVRIYSFWDSEIFIFCHFGLKLPINAHF